MHLLAFLAKMEKLAQHMHLTATQADVAQVQQWLSSYMLYAQTGVVPTVEVRPHDAHIPLMKNVRWRGTHVQVSARALQEIPPRLLALIAFRNYIETEARRRLIARSLVLSLVIAVAGIYVIGVLIDRLPNYYFRHVLHLVVLFPLHLVWRWRDAIERTMDREVAERTREAHLLIEAMEGALRVDLLVGVHRRYCEAMLSRLNVLRTENGYPELTLDDLMPPPEPEDGDGEQPVAPALSKSEFLRRHSPDDYRQVDRVVLRATDRAVSQEN